MTEEKRMLDTQTEESMPEMKDVQTEDRLQLQENAGMQEDTGMQQGTAAQDDAAAQETPAFSKDVLQRALEDMKAQFVHSPMTITPELEELLAAELKARDSRDKKLIDSIVFTFALLLILLGIYILVSGDDILKVLSVLFGILLMFDGFHSTVYAWVYARRAGRKWWGLLVILSILLFLSGIIIFNNPWWPRAHSFVKVIGGVILFSSATGIVRLILVWPLHKDK